MKYLIFFLFPISVFGQSISQAVINTTGGFGETASFSLTYSVGEVAVTTEAANNIIITQGFLQPNDNTVNTQTQTLLKFNIYPNPTHNQISFEGDLHLISKVLVVNSLGQRILTITNISEPVDLSNLSQGIYILKFFNTENITTQSYQIVKL
jgi:hypothetical protein